MLRTIIGLCFILATGSGLAVNSADVDFTITYQLNDVRFTSGPDIGLSAEGGGLDYEFYTDISHEELEQLASTGTGTFSTSSSVTKDGAPFDPDDPFGDPFLEGDEFGLLLEASSSATSPGSDYSAAREGRTEFYADIYTTEGLEFIWDITHNVATTLDNNDPDGGSSSAFADAEVDWFGEITPISTSVLLDLGYGDLCCGTPTNLGDSGGQQISLAFAPGEFYATFSFLAEVETFTNDLVPEPGAVLLTLAGGAIIALRRRRS